VWRGWGGFGGGQAAQQHLHPARAADRVGQVCAAEPGEAGFDLPGGAADDGQKPHVLPGFAGDLCGKLHDPDRGRGGNFTRRLIDQVAVAG
jgi:hypothetical protein